MDVIAPILGIAFVAAALWAMISTLVHIQKSVGIVSPTGLSWAFLIIICNLAGVVMYRWFREPIEDQARRLFRRGLH